MGDDKNGLYGIVAFILGFFIAQTSKLLISFFRDKKKSYKNFKDVVYDLTRSGGMPSGHSASFTALTVFFGLCEGFFSPIFTLSLCMTVIIIYDAVNVRFAVGEHGKLLNEIARSDGNSRTNPQRLVEGHTLSQVTVGILIGIVVGAVVYYAFIV